MSQVYPANLMCFQSCCIYLLVTCLGLALNHLDKSQISIQTKSMEKGQIDQRQDRILGLSRDVVAIVLMVAGCALFYLSYIFVNEHKFHSITTNLVRGITLTIGCYLIAKHQSINLTFPSSHNFKYQIIRAIIEVAQGIVYAWAQFYLPLPIAITLNSTSPIFATIFDRVLNGVSINRTQAGWLAVAFLGVVLVANGEYLSYLITGTQTEASSAFENYLSKDPIVALLVGGILTVTMIFHGLGIVITKKFIKTRGIHICYFSGVFILLTNAVLAPIAESDHNYHYPTSWEFGQAVLFSGIPIALGQLAEIGSLLLYKNYVKLAPFMFSSIIFGYLVSVFRYGETINVICLVGAGAIVLGTVLNAKCKQV